MAFSGKSTEVPDLAQEIASTILRISVLGPLTIEWVDKDGTRCPLPTERLSGRGAAPAFGLLKALLSQPDRFATRDWLIEQFWPDSSVRKAEERLDDVASGLRSLLRLPGHTTKLLHYVYGSNGKGGGYRLDGYPLIWVDADAFVWYVEQAARFERFGQDALPLWEQAYQLAARGMYLPEERYSDWAQAHREELAGHYRQCVHRLAALLRKQGASEQAILYLRAYWQQNKSDEDALRVLMELLGEQERYQEAEVYYQQLLLAVAEFAPTEDGHGQEPDPRTQEIREYLRTKQIQRERIPMSERTRNARRSSPALVEDISYRTHNSLSRREASQTIAAIGASLLVAPDLLSLMRIGTMLHDEEILSTCATSIPILWRLFFDGHLSEIQRVLPNYISQLALLARQPSEHQQRAASLASKAHQLACMLTLQGQDYGAALIHVDQALQTAHIANDTNLRVASLIRKALVYRYINRYLKKCPNQIIEAYQEAVQYSSAVSPLLEGRLYAGLAEANSELGLADEANHALERAYKIFPVKPQDDPNFSYTHFKLPQGFEVVMYLNLKQARNAWDVLAKLDASVPMAVIPDRVELSIDQARASFLLGDMKQSCKYLDLAATSASTLGSDLRYHEAYRLYRQVQTKWPHEQQVKELTECFHL